MAQSAPRTGALRSRSRIRTDCRQTTRATCSRRRRARPRRSSWRRAESPASSWPVRSKRHAATDGRRGGESSTARRFGDDGRSSCPGHPVDRAALDAELDRTVRETIAAHVRAGAGLFVAAAPEVDPSVLSSMTDWQPALTVVDEATCTSRSSATDPRHPIFRPFGALAANLGQSGFERAGASAPTDGPCRRFSNGRRRCSNGRSTRPRRAVRVRCRSPLERLCRCIRRSCRLRLETVEISAGGTPTDVRPGVHGRAGARGSWSRPRRVPAATTERSRSTSIQQRAPLIA